MIGRIKHLIFRRVVRFWTHTLGREWFTWRGVCWKTAEELPWYAHWRITHHGDGSIEISIPFSHTETHYLIRKPSKVVSGLANLLDCALYELTKDKGVIDK